MQSSEAAGAGVGLRVPHYRDFLRDRPAVDWLEVHTENYFQAGGWDRHVLFSLRREYPISLHGVGLGLGSVHGFDPGHLRRVKSLADELEPCLVSEHLCWGSTQAHHLNDLLPMPFTKGALDLLCDRVQQVQDSLGRTLLVENVSTYLRYRADAMTEVEFLVALCQRTGCRLLLDVNNLFVNQCNHRESATEAMAAIARISPEVVAEIHLGGHWRADDVAVDNHASRVCDAVWELYRLALGHFGPAPTLIEWDAEIPPLPVLLDEADQARALLAGFPRRACAGVARTAPSLPGRAPLTDLAAIQSEFAQALMLTHIPELDFLAGSPESAQTRFARYRGNQVATWESTMAAAFPVIRKLAGEEFFDGLAREYNLACPSSCGDLNQMGERFPEFLDSFPHVAQYPYFPDVARLEWAVHRAHYAAGPVAPLTLQQLAGWTAETLEEACFKLHPAVELFASPWASVGVWQGHQTEPVTFPEDLAVESCAVVCRPEWKPRVMEISRAAHAALSALRAGMTFGSAIDTALARDDSFNVGAHLRLWLEWGLLEAPAIAAACGTPHIFEQGESA
jgi:uncharacterized protein